MIGSPISPYQSDHLLKRLAFSAKPLFLAQQPQIEPINTAKLQIIR